MTTLPNQPVQFPAQCREVGQLPLHVGKMRASDGVHRATGLLFPVGEIEQHAYLLDGKAKITGAARKGEAACVRGGVVAVIARRAGWRGQQADALIITDGFRVGVGGSRQFSDVRLAPLTL
jgi:hypothetical protein